jgi:hypothetical protein
VSRAWVAWSPVHSPSWALADRAAQVRQGPLKAIRAAGHRLRRNAPELAESYEAARGATRRVRRAVRHASRLHFSRSGPVVVGLALVMTAGLLVATTASSKAETTGPGVVHTPVATAFYGQAIPISVRTSCTSGCAARLYYRSTAPASLLAVPGLVGEGGFQVVGLANVATGPDTTEWRGEIPGYVVTTTGLDYYVEVDQSGATTKYPGTPMAGGVQPLGIYFHVKVLSPPLINHVPVVLGFAGQPLNIDAQATCASGSCQGTLYYRTPGLLSTDYSSVGMTQTSATPLSSAGSLLTLTGQVPGSAIDTRGLDYYIGVRDGATTTYLPGTTYEGYYAPRDGAPSTNTPYHVHVVEPPRIVHAPVASAPFGQDIAITATSPCPSGRPCQGTLYYRTTTSSVLGPAGFGAASMAATRPASVAGLDTILLSGTIPGGVVDTRGVDYYFSVSDGTTTAWWPGTPPVDAPTLSMDGLQGLYHHVHVQEPVHIAPAQPPMAAPRQDLTLLAELTCSTPSCHAELHYSGQPLLPGGTFQTISMTRTAVGQASTPASRLETWSATIPASQVTTRGLAYYVTAGDGYTSTASPGTSYWGAYVPVDGMTAAPDVATYVVRVVEPPHPQLVPVGPAFTGEPQPITVASNCASPSCTATLYWQAAGPGVLGQWQSTGMAQLSRTPLAYGNDLVTYSAAIPGQPSGTALVYRVEVSDGYSTDTTPSWPLVVSDRPAPTPTTVPIPTTVPPPPATVPPVTPPPITAPPVTVPPPPATSIPPPPVTAPPVTNPPTTVPPPPVTAPPVTNPPTTVPPPPVTAPPVTNPPVTVPPVTAPPVSLPTPPSTTIPPAPITIPPPPVTVPSVPPAGQPVVDTLISCAQMGGDVGLADLDGLVQQLQDLTPGQVAGFAGAYIGLDQLVHVGVVSEAARGALPAALTSNPKVKVDRLKFSVGELDWVIDEVAGRLNGLLASPPPAQGTWPYAAKVNPFCNTVDIELDPSALPKLDAVVQALSPRLLEGSARITGVRTVRQQPTACYSRETCSPARAGIRMLDPSIDRDWGCTLGFVTRDAEGRREALTANHCGGLSWSAGGQGVGAPQWERNYGPVDAQTVSLFNENVPTPSNTIYKAGDDYGYVPRKITAPSRSLHGRHICSSGAYGYMVCGQLTSWSATFMEGRTGFGEWQGDGAAGICHGDSGGPVYDEANNSNRAYGINAGALFTSDASACGDGTNFLSWTARIEQLSGRRILTDVTTESLGPGQALYPGHVAYLRTQNDRYVLVMQGDGNLVVKEGSSVLWATTFYAGYVATPGAHAVMQGDGNFVVYAPDGTPRWDSDAHRVAGNPKVAGSYVTIQGVDGNLVVYAPDGSARYSRFHG